MISGCLLTARIGEICRKQHSLRLPFSCWCLCRSSCNLSNVHGCRKVTQSWFKCLGFVRIIDLTLSADFVYKFGKNVFYYFRLLCFVFVSTFPLRFRARLCGLFMFFFCVKMSVRNVCVIFWFAKLLFLLRQGSNYNLHFVCFGLYTVLHSINGNVNVGFSFVWNISKRFTFGFQFH